MIHYTKIEIPGQKITLLMAKNDKGVCSIEFSSNVNRFLKMLAERYNDSIEFAPEMLKAEVRQIMEYFSGRRKSFDMKLFLKGTVFQKKVWKTIAEVKYGKTASYDWISRKIKNPGALQAVGSACGRNPVPIVIPCHRIISKDGRIGGFGGGLTLKRKLLKIEKVVI